ncbi:MAG: hypothetical protein Q9216_007065 [Gyalolechia sp. 2 TL-2023]
MTAMVKLDAAECETYFAPVLGAFVMSQAPNSYATVSSEFAKESAKSYSTTLDQNAVAKISTSLKINAVTSLGTACFGYVFELYKKKVQDKEEIGPAFGLSQLSDRKVFLTRFPKSVVRTWDPRKDFQYWFSSMIRNAFAHAQWRINSHGGVKPSTIDLKNYDLTNKQTFDVTMELTDLRNVIAAALHTFIENVQPGPGKWPPSPPSANPPVHEILYRVIHAELQLFKLEALFEGL